MVCIQVVAKEHGRLVAECSRMVEAHSIEELAQFEVFAPVASLEQHTLKLEACISSLLEELCTLLQEMGSPLVR